jgi:integrase
VRLKGLLKLAEMEGFPVNQDYKKWTIGSEKSSELSIALTVEELAEMELIELPDYLARVRDLFLIGVYTGLRFSDYSTIDIAAAVDSYLTIIQQKTKGKVVIPIGQKLSKIFDLYNGKLPQISNQKFNKYIKLVAAECSLLKKQEILAYTKGGKHIEESKSRADLVSSHTARRTFATLAYERGTPVQAIMAITGHKTGKSFMAYIKTSKEKQAEIFKKYEK